MSETCRHTHTKLYYNYILYGMFRMNFNNKKSLGTNTII